MIFLNCNPGENAIVRGGPSKALLGKVVKVGPRIWPTIIDKSLVYSVNGRQYAARTSDGCVWLCEIQGLPPIFGDRSGEQKRVVEHPMMPLLDTWLCALRDCDGTDQMVLRAGPAPREIRRKSA